MYKKAIPTKTSLNVNDHIEGETIEQKIERVVNNKEPITDGAPIVYTERKDGVIPAYDPRTDKWDVAIDATDYISKSHIAKRKAALEERKLKENPPKETGGETSPEVSQ